MAYHRLASATALVGTSSAVFLYNKLNQPCPAQSSKIIKIDESHKNMTPIAPFALGGASKQEEVVPVGQASFQIANKGFPSTTNIIFKQNYIISYDRERKQPHWVMERILKNQVSIVDVAERSDKFKQEDSLHEYFRSQNSDYAKSGYDRGHMAAAANHRHTQDSMDETFTLANMCPQHPGLNRGIWSSLEAYTRSMAQHNNSVFVVSGPMYLPWKNEEGKKFVTYEVIGENNVAVATHFFKLIIVERNDGKFDIKCFVLPNVKVEGKELNDFLCDPRFVEKSCGLLFYNKLPVDKIHSVNKPINKKKKD